MSQRFESYEKEPSAQLTQSVFDTLNRFRKHRTTQILLASILLLCIVTVGSLLYINERKAGNESHVASTQTRMPKTQHPGLSPSTQPPTSPASSIIKQNSTEDTEAITPEEKANSGKSRIIQTLHRDLAVRKPVLVSEELQPPILAMPPFEAEKKIATINLLNNKSVSFYTSALKIPEPVDNLKYISASKPIENRDWKLIASLIPTNSFQKLHVIPKDGLIYQNFRFPKAADIRYLGYKFQVGVERKGLQLLVNYSQFSHSVTYDVAGSEFILVPDGLNDRKPVRKTKTIHDENSVRQIGIGLKKHLLFTKGALRRHYFDLGAEAAKQLGGDNNALWLNASFGKEIQMPGRTSLAIGPYVEYSLQKFKDPGQVYLSTPYQVGISIGLSVSK